MRVGRVSRAEWVGVLRTLGPELDVTALQSGRVQRGNVVAGWVRVEVNVRILHCCSEPFRVLFSIVYILLVSFGSDVGMDFGKTFYFGRVSIHRSASKLADLVFEQ